MAKNLVLEGKTKRWRLAVGKKGGTAWVLSRKTRGMSRWITRRAMTRAVPSRPSWWPRLQAPDPGLLGSQRLQLLRQKPLHEPPLPAAARPRLSPRKPLHAPRRKHQTQPPSPTRKPSAQGPKPTCPRSPPPSPNPTPRRRPTPPWPTLPIQPRAAAGRARRRTRCTHASGAAKPAAGCDG